MRDQRVFGRAEGEGRVLLDQGPSFADAFDLSEVFAISNMAEVPFPQKSDCPIPSTSLSASSRKVNEGIHSKRKKRVFRCFA